MANPTTNYGFVLPTPTDLVTDLPADFDVALQGVDTRIKALNPSTTLGDTDFSSAVANVNTRLAIGTAGQILTVAGGVPTWAAANPGDITGVAAGVGISGGGTSGDVTVTNSMATTIDAKGDVIAGTADNAFARLAVGANNTVLTADSTTATGLKWAASGGSMVGAQAYRTTNQAITAGVITAILYTTETFDTDAYHDTSTNTSRMTIPSGKGGKYLLTGSLAYDIGPTNFGEIRIYRNGAALGNGLVAGITNRASITGIGLLCLTIVSASVGDYFELFALSSNTSGNITNSEFSIVYLGA